MRSIRRHQHGAAEVAMTPMLDIVFILLIFFIVTTTFAAEETIGIEAPAPTDGGNPSSAMLIQVTEEGLISINGRYADIGAVGANIERVKAEMPDAMIVLEVRPKTRVGIIALIRDAAYDAGFVEGVSLKLVDAD
ncbi:biopolymer transporter ExbD [Hyphomonas sp.]|jgi:biopolymer transport protein ExbD|uniref:ExbD/TolR family protein n=1 Tax=Hyphomonas sp. TaxID=87 RepID=UPI0025BB5BE5|nr:biopolymer transporter ExbD [Hyphomonas sp.]